MGIDNDTEIRYEKHQSVTHTIINYMHYYVYIKMLQICNAQECQIYVLDWSSDHIIVYRFYSTLHLDSKFHNRVQKSKILCISSTIAVLAKSTPAIINSKFLYLIPISRYSWYIRIADTQRSYIHKLITNKWICHNQIVLPILMWTKLALKYVTQASFIIFSSDFNTWWDGKQQEWNSELKIVK